MSNKKYDNWTVKFYKIVEDIIERKTKPAVEVGQITSLEPLTVLYNGVEFSNENSEIFCNELLLEENIDLPVDGIYLDQSFINVSPYVPNAFTGAITGTLPDFIKDFYNWFKTWHNKYILKAGDYVTLQKLGDKRILILEKVKRL